jgi:hypothetical protein
MSSTLRVLGALAPLVVLAAACGETTNAAGPSVSGPLPDGGTGTVTPTGPSGLPCDVDKVLADNCRKCHSAPPQYGAPMPLLTWDNLQAAALSDATKKVHELVATMIASETAPMPPPPNARLSEADRKTLGDWSAAGAPRSTDDCSNTTKLPPPPGLSCTPDLTLAPASPWEMPENAGDEYVCWGVDLSKEQASHITAFAPRIDNTTITHHVVLYEAGSKYSGVPTPCGAGSALSWRMVLGWAPGVQNFELPPEAGFPIATDPAKPTHYVVQMHYSNPQKLKGQKDASKIDVCTSPPRKYEADVMAFGSQEFTIPAAPPPGGVFTLDCSLTVPAQFAGLHLFAAMPHMHKLGAAMSTKLTPKAGGPDVDLGTMPAFSFDAQAWLPLDATLASGDVIRTQCGWKNGTGAEVSFGEKTAEEMCYSFTMYYPKIQSGLWSWALPSTVSQCQ